MTTRKDEYEEIAMANSSAHSMISQPTIDDGTTTIDTSDQAFLLEHNDELQHQLEQRDHPPIGLLSEFCQHDHVIRFDLKPLLASWSGLDIVVSPPEPDGSMKRKVSRKDQQPFYIAGKKLISATLSDSDHKQLYSLHQKWTTFHTHYYAKNLQGEKVIDLRADKLLKFNLTATFKNSVDDGKERKLELKTGLVNKMSELRDENGRLLATIERPKKSRMIMPNEPFRVNIAPKVDSSLVLAICLGMHTQLLTFKIATYYAPSSAGVLASTASSS